MLILAFDTATPAVTVALYDGRRVVAGEQAVDARRHGELLAPAITAVLATAQVRPAELTAVAVGVGPGPYTGLRAGLVTAQVLGATLDVPAHGFCTLDIIAAQARLEAGGREFLVATDARRREVYWARYSGTGERFDGPRVSSPADVPTGFPIAGEGPRLYAELGGNGAVIEPIFCLPARPSRSTCVGRTPGSPGLRSGSRRWCAPARWRGERRTPPDDGEGRA